MRTCDRVFAEFVRVFGAKMFIKAFAYEFLIKLLRAKVMLSWRHLFGELLLSWMTEAVSVFDLVCRYLKKICSL